MDVEKGSIREKMLTRRLWAMDALADKQSQTIKSLRMQLLGWQIACAVLFWCCVAILIEIK